MAYEIDQEVRKIVNACHDKAREIITQHKKELESIANALIENETLTNEQIRNIVQGLPMDGEVLPEAQ